MNLLEDPTPIIVAGVIVEAGLAIALFRTGRGLWLFWMIGVAAVTLLGVVIERLVVTQREEVAMTVYAAAEAVANNDRTLARSYLAPEAADARGSIEWAMRQVTFEKINVHLGTLSETVRINRHTSPPTATAKISGMAYFTHPSWPYKVQPFAGTLEFRLEGKKWLVTDYHWDDDPRKAITGK